LIVIHVHVAKRDQPGVCVEGILSSLGRWIVPTKQEVEILDLVKGRTRARWKKMLFRHDEGKKVVEGYAM
jgi:hypothetical protein